MDPPPPPPPAAAPGPPPGGWSPPGPSGGTPPSAQRSIGRGLWAIAIVLVLLAVAAVVIVVVHKSGGPVSGPSATAATATNFTDPTNHFSAAYHDPPAQDNQVLTVSGHQINETMWSDSIDTNTTEIVGFANFSTDFDFSAPNAALNGSVTGEVNNTHGTLVSKKFGTYQGFHSVDAVISAGGGYAETRAIIAGRTLYIVVVTSLNNPPELFSGFANSLHILNHSA